MPRIFRTLTMILVASCSLSYSQSSPSVLLMPIGSHFTPQPGVLPIDNSFRIDIEADTNDELVRSAAERLSRSFEKISGAPVPIENGKPLSSPGLTVIVHRAAQFAMNIDESYSLTISATGARLEAPTSIGALRGLATLRQLGQSVDGKALLPASAIQDGPLYPWRGLSLDCARHFMPLDLLKRNLDAMELVKLNVLHLHLSDNEGFRIESKTFPKLQADGSNGEFYTQAEMRDLIHYAALRGVMIVPEFDMPSHTISWLAAYPELSASPGPFKPGQPPFQGITPHSTMAEIAVALQKSRTPAFDPSRESTYTFLDSFVAEMAALFPAPYFHIGADENNGAVWLANPSIVAFMQTHRLADAPALQAYFVNRVHTIVEQHGKQMVAWEEAYSGGSTPNTIYQVWSPLAKTDLLHTPMTGNDKLLVSKGFYLDLFYPAHAYYENSALPAGPQPPGSPLLGGEAAMWVEIADRTNVEARLWPRAGAIAERLWSTAAPTDLPDFYNRLFALSSVLDREGVHNLTDYTSGVQQLARPLPSEPVRTLLDVLTPIKGYKRLMIKGLNPAGGPAAPFNQVADVVLCDSQVKYRFRAAVTTYLATHDAASASALRTWLSLWQQNDRRLSPYWTQSSNLQQVSGHSKSLAALSAATLKALDRQQQGQPLSTAELAGADALLKSAQTTDGQTEIAVLPEIEAIFHGTLPPEPGSYPLF